MDLILAPLEDVVDRFKKDRKEVVQAMLSAIPWEDRVSVKDDIGTDSLFVAKPLKAKDYLLAQLHSIVIHVDRARVSERPNEKPQEKSVEKKQTPSRIKGSSKLSRLIALKQTAPHAAV